MRNTCAICPLPPAPPNSKLSFFYLCFVFFVSLLARPIPKLFWLSLLVFTICCSSLDCCRRPGTIICFHLSLLFFFLNCVCSVSHRRLVNVLLLFAFPDFSSVLLFPIYVPLVFGVPFLPLFLPRSQAILPQAQTHIASVCWAGFVH